MKTLDERAALLPPILRRRNQTTPNAREVKAALAAIYGRTVSLARVRAMLRDNPIVEGMSSEEATVAINAHLEDDAR